MFPKNGVGRPVFPHASGGFSRAHHPTGHFAAYRDLVRETLSVADLAHRIHVRRMPSIYRVSPRLIDVQSRLLKLAVLTGIVIVTPALLIVTASASAGSLIRCKVLKKACAGCAYCHMKER